MFKLAWSGRGRAKRIVSSGYDKTIKVWDVASGQLIQTYQGHTQQHDDIVNNVCFSLNGKYLVSSSLNGVIKLWDTEELKNIKNVRKIFTTLNAFAALNVPEGKVITWGDARYGGDSTSVREKLMSNVHDIFPGEDHFIALKKSGELVYWGGNQHSYGKPNRKLLFEHPRYVEYIKSLRDNEIEHFTELPKAISSGLVSEYL